MIVYVLPGAGLMLRGVEPNEVGIFGVVGRVRRLEHDLREHRPHQRMADAGARAPRGLGETRAGTASGASPPKVANSDSMAKIAERISRDVLEKAKATLGRTWCLWLFCNCSRLLSRAAWTSKQADSRAGGG